MKDKNYIGLYRKWLHYVLYCCVFLSIGGTEIIAQIVIPFTPRTSAQAPGKYKNVSIYKIQGDFKRIGNTNHYPTKYDPTKDNTQVTAFVDVDSDASTINSSSAQLILEQPCSEILFAGLYWLGTAAEGDLNVGGGKILNRYKIKFKHEKEASYRTLTATTQFPAGRYYGGFVDVTDIVRQNGIGNYYGADIAIDNLTTTAHNKVGGWSLVVVYRNTSLSWKDITVYDGLMDIDPGKAGEFQVSGFRTPATGPVNVTMGYFAGEGDRIYVGDYLSIFSKPQNKWVDLVNPQAGNTANNFFNATITPNDYARNPKVVDNLGIDIGKFALPNSTKNLVGNSETNMRLHTGSLNNGDGFYITGIVLGIDAFVSDIIAENKIVTAGVTDGGNVTASQDLKWNLTIRNGGSEAVGNGKITIPIPSNLHYISSTIDQSKTIKGTVVWTPPAGAPANAVSASTPGGTLTWNFGADVPLAAIGTVLGSIDYNLRVVDCATLLSTANSACISGFSINGVVTGLGRTTGSNLGESLVKTPGLCGTGSRDDSDFTAKVVIPTSCGGIVNGVRAFESSCTLPVNVIKRATIVAAYPAGTKFYRNAPGTANYLTTEVTGDFPATTTGITNYYALRPGTAEGCYLRLSTIYRTTTSSPTVSNIAVCSGQGYQMTAKVSKAGLNLYYYTASAGGTPLASPPAPTAVGVYTYYVAEGVVVDGGYCVGPRKPFTITINALPTITPLAATTTLCVGASLTITPQTSGDVTGHSFEYALSATPTTWVTLTNTSFPNNQLTYVGKELRFNNVTQALNGIKLRYKVSNANGCVTYSNVMSVVVNYCSFDTRINPNMSIDKK